MWAFELEITPATISTPPKYLSLGTVTLVDISFCTCWNIFNDFNDNVQFPMIYIEQGVDFGNFSYNNEKKRSWKDVTLWQMKEGRETDNFNFSYEHGERLPAMKKFCNSQPRPLLIHIYKHIQMYTFYTKTHPHKGQNKGFCGKTWLLKG